MNYASITFRDKNFIKRWLQRKRLLSAIKISNLSNQGTETILDFGSGNGELIKELSHFREHGEYICFEPTVELLTEARENLIDVNNVAFYDKSEIIEDSLADIVFCLAVFEHLPTAEALIALHTIKRIAKPDALIIIGVPVEVGIPALYKGVFRKSRRSNTFDTDWSNIFKCFLCNPPDFRPTAQIAPGFNYHFEHTGFDYTAFERTLSSHFSMILKNTSPFGFLGASLMPEISYLLKQKPSC